jgi:hypothetical protein
MMQNENSVLSSPVPWYKFWLPSDHILIPAAPPGHYYVPLHESPFSAQYNGNLSSFPGLSEIVNSTSFTTVITNATFALKSPYFKYTFIRFFILLLFLVYFIEFIVSCATGNVGGVIIYLIFLGLCPIGVRLGSNQYLARMLKYEKVLKKCCLGMNSTILSGSGLVVEPGRYCKWLDFHTGGYSPPPPAATFVQNPAYYFPGTQVSYA